MTSVAAQTLRTPASMEELERFWANHCPSWRSSWRGAGSKEALERLVLERSRQLLQNERTSKIVVRHYGAVAGVACLTPLDWDTEQFGFPAARLDLACVDGYREQSIADQTELLDRILEDCRRQSIGHLTARVDAGELTTIHALEHAGFELIDGIQTFSLRLPAPAEELEPACEIRLYRETDLEQILEIARSSYVFDRFHADSALSSAKADRINETWVHNCCLGRMADAVIVAAKGEVVLAYATCKIDEAATRVLGVGCGVIGMVATIASARKLGVAAAANRGSLDWFQSQGVEVVEVGTQLRNVPAGRLYERCGFRLTAVSLTFRKWIGDWSGISIQRSHDAI
jgi:RimJ/RimL family protein N-acetyltransferase